MPKTYRPIKDRVLVRFTDDQDWQSPSGLIVLPNKFRDKGVRYGVVVAVGDGMYTRKGVKIPFSVKKDDKVLVGHFAPGATFKLDGVEHRVCCEADLLVVQEEK